MADLWRRAFDIYFLRYLEANLGEQDGDRRTAYHFDLQVIGEYRDLFDEVLYEDVPFAYVALSPDFILVEVGQDARYLLELNLQVRMKCSSVLLELPMNERPRCDLRSTLTPVQNRLR